MAQIILPNTWRSPPVGPVDVDWSHPLLFGAYSVWGGRNIGRFTRDRGAQPGYAYRSWFDTFDQATLGSLTFVSSTAGNQTFGSGFWVSNTDNQLVGLMYYNGDNKLWAMCRCDTSSAGGTTTAGGALTPTLGKEYLLTSLPVNNDWRNGINNYQGTNEATLHNCLLAGSSPTQDSRLAPAYSTTVSPIIYNWQVNYFKTPTRAMRDALRENPWQIFKPLPSRRYFIALVDAPTETIHEASFDSAATASAAFDAQLIALGSHSAAATAAFATDASFGLDVRYGRPMQDISDGAWLPSTPATELYEMVDEVLADDADYIYTDTASVCEVKLSGIIDPLSSNGHKVSLRIPAGFTPRGSLAVSLREGASTEIAAWAIPTPTADTLYQFYLGDIEADSITDYTDLRVRLEAITA